MEKEDGYGNDALIYTIVHRYLVRYFIIECNVLSYYDGDP